MSLLIDAPFSNVTTYRKDYTKKCCPSRSRVIFERDFEDPIAGPLEDQVLPYFKFKKLPKNQNRFPHPGEYADVVAERYPTTRTFLKDPPGCPLDLNVVDKLYENENRTIYMVSYCRLGDYDSKKKGERMTKPLPEGWVVPLTTQKCSYRDPCLLSPEGFAKIQIHIPKNNLTPNMKEREVLEVKTGETTYQADISNTGDEIIKGKMHGDVNIRPQFDHEQLLKAKLIRTH